MPSRSLLALALASVLTPALSPLAQAADVAAPAAKAAAAKPAAKKLSEVVVSAAGFEQAIKEAPASITVISGEELAQKRYSSLAEALVDVEGIDVGDSAGKTGGLNIGIRGMPSDYTLVLIDGRRQNSPGNVTPNGFTETATSFMPPMNAIERIEIIRGPMSTLYGSDAMGGVINIITRKVAAQWSGSLNVDATAQEEDAFGNSHSAKVYGSGPLVADTLGVALRGSMFKRDAASISYVQQNGTEVTPIMGANPTEAEIRSAGLRFSYTPDKAHELVLDLDRSEQDYDNGAGNLGTVDSGNRIGGYARVQQYNREQMALTHTWRGANGQLESSLMQNFTETIGRTIPTGTPGKRPGSPRTLEVDNTVFDSRYVTGFEAGGSHMLSVGGQWWEAEMIDGVAPAPYDHQQWALFAENEWRFVDDLALTLGLRHDDHSVFGGHNSPRAYLVWTASKHWTLRGGVSRGFKTPRLDQLAAGIVGFGGQGTIPLLGSPGLKPETSTSMELGAQYDGLNGTAFGLTLFDNRFEDKIAAGPGLLNCSWRTRPNRPGCVDFGNWPNVDAFGQSINIDEAVTRGVELNGKHSLGGGWSLSGNYTYTDSEQKSGANKGMPLTNTPEHMLNAKLDWTLSEALSLWLRGEYRSERYRTLAVGQNASRDALGDYKAYELFHLGGSWKLSATLSLNATLYNLLNKDFLEYTAYPAPTTANPNAVAYSNVYNNNQEGRRLWLALNLSF